MQNSWLRSFHYTATLGRISAAADQLNVANSSISTQIRQLEEYFGVRLFVREHNRLIMTEVGARLVEDTKAYFELEEAIRWKLGKAYSNGTSHIRIGSEHPSTTATAINDMAKANGKPTNFVIFGRTQNVLYKWFREHRIDIIVSYTPPDDVASMTGKTTALRTDFANLVADERYIEHLGIGRQDTDIERLLETATWILQKKGATTRRVFDTVCSHLDAVPKMVIEVSSYSDVVDAVKNSLGIGILIRNGKSGEYYGQQYGKLMQIKMALPNELTSIFALRKFIHCQNHVAKSDESKSFIKHCLQMNPPEKDA